MNNLNVLIGNNTNGVMEEVLKRLNGHTLDTSENNIVIVPDRLSLFVEQSIFKILNIEVYFNIEVMGISKFVNKVIKESGLDVLTTSALESKLLVLKAILNVKHKFKCFSDKFTFGLVDEIYAKIEQIKSSDADILDLYDESASEGTKLKFEDLKLIFLEYEKLRNGKLDSGALISFFSEIATESKILKNSNVFFVGFDSMTKQGIGLLKNVVKNALSTYVGVVAPYNQENKNIYDKTFLDAIVSLCKQQKFESELKWLDLNLKNADADMLLKNVFARKNQIDGSGYVTTYKSAGVFDEIDFAVKSINYNLKTKSIDFNDIAVCAPKPVQEILKSKLELLGIKAYVDKNYALIDLEPIKFILSYLKYLNEPYEKKHLIHIINNEFCLLSKGQKEELNNLLNQYSSINIIKSLKCVDQEIVNYLNAFETVDKTNLNVNYYFEIIEKIIDKNNIYTKTSELCETFKQKGEIGTEKLYIQIETKFNNLCLEIKNVLQNEQMEFGEFLELFEKGLIEQELMGVPSTINEVFIGDVKSFYWGKKYVYILSANDGIFPEILSDSGLISDKEISSDSIKAKLEPTTKIINKRNKFKALEVLLSAQEKCYLIYHTISKDGKTAIASEFVEEVNRILKQNTVETSMFKFYENGKVEFNKICFNNENVYNANLNLRKSENNSANAVVSGALLNGEQMFFAPIKKQEKIDYTKMFFKGDNASVSAIEKYNACPKSAFLAYGLRLKKNKKEKVEANVIGSFIHEMCEKFVKYNKKQLGKMEDANIVKSADDICDKIIEKEDYYSLKLEENSFILGLIKKECRRFCKFLNYEQSVSEFKVKYTEKYFGKNSDFKPLTIMVGGKQYTICGIVDRIDECEDYYRIIDYKSGNTTNSKGKDGLFYGNKIQLFVYAQAIRQNMDKKLFGVFYLPIKNGFSESGKSDYYFSGFFTSDVSLAMKSDSNLTMENKNSKILVCSLNKPDKNGEITLAKKENIMLDEELDGYINYSVEVFKQAIIDIENGFMECSPFSGKCAVCEFSSICQNAGNKKIERGEDYEIKKSTFLEINYGE